MRFFYTLITLFLFSTISFAQTLTEEEWVNSQYVAMNDTQRIGQLFMIRAHSNKGADHIAEVEYLIKKYYIGSLCFFQGTIERQAELTNRYQNVSTIPLLIAMDAEWGLNMRIKTNTIEYPKQLMLGAIQDNKLIYQFGAAVAKELKRLGVHLNFAPSVDINNNALNPVINERSFGEDKYNVAIKGFMYMQGMQDNGVLACAKHFPGHGDTDVDSHKDLPVVLHDRSRLEEFELMPFRALSQWGVASVMVGHLQVPSIDNTINTPTSLSKNAIKYLLRDEMGFDGLIFTDALEMKGVKKYYTQGEIAVKALEAGNDVLCLLEDIPEAFKAIQNALLEGRIDSLEIEKSVKRVLRAKYKLGLLENNRVDLGFLSQDINNYESQTLRKDLIKNALTLVRNEENLLPFKSFQPDSMATLSIGTTSLSTFQYTLNNYGLFNQFNLPNWFSQTKKEEMLHYFSNKKIVIVGLHDMKPRAKDDFGLNSIQKEFINELSKVTKVVLVVFGSPYALKYFDEIPTLVCAYEEDKPVQELAAEGLFGTFEFRGKLPVTASEKAKGGMGFNTQTMPTSKSKMLKWNSESPEAIGMNSKTLQKIDDIAQELIAKGAAPSCQILVAKDAQVVYHKAFGYHTYEKTQAATTDDLYDLASITKCAATTLALMKLYEEGKIDIYEKMSKYLPILRGSNKEDLRINDILIHQAGLQAWIPFYKNTLEISKNSSKLSYYPSSKWYSSTHSSDYSIEVAKDLYMRYNYVDTILQQIIDSPLRSNRNYVYSDLGMILMTYLVKEVSGKSLDEYVKDNFYTPLSMSHTLFNPLQKFDESQIVPTEEDGYFRMRRLKGHVHDMAAAMLGGVSGHAGLFSNARDLSILLQMLLNKGEYNGIQYLKPETIAIFTTRQGGSTRRGFGWDMKEIDSRKTPNMSEKASDFTFGHSGFTGNVFYADPQFNLIYIFLSNRTYPDMDNNKLINGEYRQKIQSVIYEAMK